MSRTDGLHADEAIDILEKFLLAIASEHIMRGLSYVIVGQERHTGTADPARGTRKIRLADAIGGWLDNYGYVSGGFVILRGRTILTPSVAAGVLVDPRDFRHRPVAVSGTATRTLHEGRLAREMAAIQYGSLGRRIARQSANGEGTTTCITQAVTAVYQIEHRRLRLETSATAFAHTSAACISPSFRLRTSTTDHRE